MFTSKYKNTRKLRLEPLEERALLSGISFSAPAVYNYANSASGNLTLDLQAAQYMQILDMDGDSVDDIVATYKSEVSPILFYKGNANGTFNSPVEMGTPSGQSASLIAIANVTGNSTPDWISIGIGSSDITVYAGVSGSTPSFNVKNPITISLTALNPSFPLRKITGLQTADANMDGNIDLILSVQESNYSQTLNSVVAYNSFYNAVNGAILSPTELKVNNASISTPIIAAGNFTGTANNFQIVTLGTDGNHLLYNTTKTSPAVYSFSSNISNTSYTYIGGSAIAANVQASTANLELISGVVKDNQYYVQISGSTGILKSVPVAIRPEYIAVGNISSSYTGNEILISNGLECQLLVWNASLSNYEAKPKITTSPKYHTTFIHNLNRNGPEDIIAVGETVLTVFIDGDMTKPTHVLNLDTFNIANAESFSQAVFGYFDGDLYLDMAILHANGTAISIYAGTAGPTYFTPKLTLSANNATSIVTGAFFAQGKTAIAFLDQESSAEGSNKVINIVSFAGGFTENAIVKQSYYTGLATPRILAAGDFSTKDMLAAKDGLDDLVAINKNSSGNTNTSITLFPNRGNATFTNAFVVALGLPSTANLKDIALADLDADNDIDIVLLNSGTTLNGTNSGEILVLRQSSTGTFSASNAVSFYSIETYLTGGEPSAMAIANLDGDSASSPDILVVPTNSSDKSAARILTNISAAKGALFNSTPAVIETGTFSGFEKSRIGVVVGKFQDGSSNDIVLVAGKSVRKIVNKTTFASELATSQIIFRDLSSSESSLSWVDEWTSFYVEIWLNLKDKSSALTEFSGCTLTYDPAIFQFKLSENADNTGNLDSFTPVLNSAGNLSLSGSLNKSAQTKSKNGSVLVAKILMRPAESSTGANVKETVGVHIQPSGYAVPVDSGITVSSLTVKQGDKQGFASIINFYSLSVYPVMFDLNDDGRVNTKDFSLFIKSYGKNALDAAYKHFDFNYSSYSGASTKINTSDFSAFIKSYGKTRANAIKTAAPIYVSVPATTKSIWNDNSLLSQVYETPSFAAKSYTIAEIDTFFGESSKSAAANAVDAVLSAGL